MSGYGQHFESMYTGSMVGMGSDVFAVWGYVIANRRAGMVELNPAYLSAVIGMTREAAASAIAKLCSPDAESRNPDEEGRRLVHERAFAYRVVSAQKYMDMAMAMNKRERDATRQAEHRASRSVTGCHAPSQPVTPESPSVAHSDSDSDSDSDSEAKRESPRKRGERSKKPHIPLPDDFRPNDVGISHARKAGWTPERIAEQLTRFVDHALAGDVRHADWQAAWRTWVGRSKDFERPSGVMQAARGESGVSPTMRKQLERVQRLELEELADKEAS